MRQNLFNCHWCDLITCDFFYPFQSFLSHYPISHFSFSSYSFFNAEKTIRTICAQFVLPNKVSNHICHFSECLYQSWILINEPFWTSRLSVIISNLSLWTLNVYTLVWANELMIDLLCAWLQWRHFFLMNRIWRGKITSTFSLVTRFNVLFMILTVLHEKYNFATRYCVIYYPCYQTLIEIKR